VGSGISVGVGIVGFGCSSDVTCVGDMEFFGMGVQEAIVNPIRKQKLTRNTFLHIFIGNTLEYVGGINKLTLSPFEVYIGENCTGKTEFHQLSSLCQADQSGHGATNPHRKKRFPLCLAQHASQQPGTHRFDAVWRDRIAP